MAITSLGKRTMVASVLLTVAAIAAVVARLWVRRAKRVPIKADDYTIVLVLVIAIALCVIDVWATSTGLFGLPLEQMSRARYSQYTKVTFISVILTQTCFGLVKISVLLFYKRIFVTRRFRLIANTFIGISTGFILVMIFGQVFSTNPPDRVWVFPPDVNPLVDNGLVFNYNLWLVIMQTVNMILDVTILTLPLPVIKRLNISTAKKLSLLGCFATGSFCVIASAVRLYWTVRLYQVVHGLISPLEVTNIFTWNNIWASVEVCSSIIAACLPILSPLLAATDRFIKSTKSIASRSRLLLSSLKPSKSTSTPSSRTDSQSQDKIFHSHSHHSFDVSTERHAASKVGTVRAQSHNLTQSDGELEVAGQNIIRVEQGFGVSYEDKPISDRKPI